MSEDAEGNQGAEGTQGVGDAARRLRLAPHVRLKFDAKRDCWVLLAPERLLLLDPTGVEILQRLTGEVPLSAVIDDLAAAYDAPRAEINRDVRGFVGDLRGRGLLVE